MPEHRLAGGQPRPGLASVTAYRSGEAEVLALGGDIDMATSPQVAAGVHHCLADRPAVLVVDLTAVTFLGSAGLAALVQAHDAAGEQVSVRVVAANRVVWHPIELTGLGKKLAVYGSLEQALAGSGRLGQP
ncbi:MAG TPA: STAS domain-containing protein [Pseudonocardiaceae bacterium]